MTKEQLLVEIAELSTKIMKLVQDHKDQNPGFTGAVVIATAIVDDNKEKITGFTDKIGNRTVLRQLKEKIVEEIDFPTISSIELN